MWPGYDHDEDHDAEIPNDRVAAVRATEPIPAERGDASRPCGGSALGGSTSGAARVALADNIGRNPHVVVKALCQGFVAKRSTTLAGNNE